MTANFLMLWIWLAAIVFIVCALVNKIQMRRRLPRATRRFVRGNPNGR